YDDLFLSNYALINIKDELLRVDGVSDISIMGERDYSIRVWLDPQELASRNMTAVDVAQAIRQQNIQAAAGQVGQPPAGRGQSHQLPIDTLGRLSDPEQFGEIVIKVAPSQPVTTVSMPIAASADTTTSGMITAATMNGMSGSAITGSPL